MAQVPYDPNLSVAPSGDPLSVPAARPEAFGALTAEAKMRQGAAIAGFGQQVGSALSGFDALIKHQKALTDELAANDAMTSAMKDVTGAWSEYNTKEGAGAVAALPGFHQKLDEIYQKHLEAAPSLEAKAHLSGPLRSLTDSYYKYSQNYADSQFKTWQNKSATEGAQAMGSQAIIAVDNPQQRNMFLAGSDDQIRKLGEQKGLDLPAIDNLVRENRGFNITTMVKSLLANGMSEKAQKIYDEYKDQMDATSRVASEGMLKPIAIQKKAIGGVDDIIHKGVQTPEGASAGSGTVTVGLEKSKLPDQYNQSIANHAHNLGANPADLYAVINYESRFRTNVQGGKGGNYFGLIQFGPREREKYGVHPGMSFDEQMNSVEHYLRDRGFKPGMGLAEMYSIINAGSLDKQGQPRWSASDGNGNIQSHVANIKANFYPGGEAKVDETSTSPWKTAAAAPQVSGGAGGDTLVGGAGLPQPQGAQFPAQGSGAGIDTGLPDKGWAMQQILDQTKDEPELRGPMLEYLNKVYQASADSQLEVQRQMAIQKAQIEQISDQNEVKMLQAIDSNDPNFNLLDMEKTPSNQLTREAKERIRSTYLAKLSGNEESAISKKNVADLTSQIYDGKMPTMAPAVKLLGEGGLTQSGFNFVQKQFDELRTPDGQKLSDLKGRLINGFKAQITGSNSLLGKLDPKGDENLYNFQWFIDKRITAYREAGKDWTELFDPSNANYIGKPETVKAFTSTMSEIMKRLVDQNTGMTGEEAATGASPEAVYSGEKPETVTTPSEVGPELYKPSHPFFNGIIPRKPGESIEQYRARTGTRVPRGNF